MRCCCKKSFCGNTFTRIINMAAAKLLGKRTHQMPGKNLSPFQKRSVSYLARGQGDSASPSFSSRCPKITLIPRTEVFDYLLEAWKILKSLQMEARNRTRIFPGVGCILSLLCVTPLTWRSPLVLYLEGDPYHISYFLRTSVESF